MSSYKPLLRYKDNLKRAIEIIKDLDFENNEIDEIYWKGQNLIKNKHFKYISDKLMNTYKNNENSEDNLRIFTESIDPKDLTSIIKILAKNEDLLNYIQDLLLEKLL